MTENPAVMWEVKVVRVERLCILEEQQTSVSLHEFDNQPDVLDVPNLPGHAMGRRLDPEQDLEYWWLLLLHQSENERQAGYKSGVRRGS